jgi:hypothetical protein
MGHGRGSIPRADCHDEVGHLGGGNHLYWRLETCSTAGIGSGYSAKVVLLRVDSILPACYIRKALPTIKV